MERAHRPEFASTFNGSPAAHAVDRHWAVASVENGKAVLADAVRVATTLHLGGDTLVGEDADRAIGLASAYDLAGRDIMRQMQEDRRGERADELREQLQTAASRAFILYLVLPVPTDPEGLAVRKLHLSGLAEIASRAAQFSRWRSRHPLPELHDRHDWPIWLLEQTTEVWCELFRGGEPPDTERIADLIASGREMQLEREQAFLAALLGSAVDRAKLYLFALHHVMDAATDVFLYMRHHAPDQRARVDGMHFVLALEATSGNPQMETTMSWLHAAAMRLTNRHSWQLGLPGLRE